MNFIDFENDFDLILEFEGDNETDVNKVRISRETFDGYGNEIQVGETYYMPTIMLEDIANGLEDMAEKIRLYLAKP